MRASARRKEIPRVNKDLVDAPLRTVILRRPRVSRLYIAYSKKRDVFFFSAARTHFIHLRSVRAVCSRTGVKQRRGKNLTILYLSM